MRSLINIGDKQKRLNHEIPFDLFFWVGPLLKKYCKKPKTMRNTSMKPAVVLDHLEFGKKLSMTNNNLSKPFLRKYKSANPLFPKSQNNK